MGSGWNKQAKDLGGVAVFALFLLLKKSEMSWLSVLLIGGQKSFLAKLLKVQVSGTVQPASDTAFSFEARGTIIFH